MNIITKGFKRGTRMNIITKGSYSGDKSTPIHVFVEEALNGECFDKGQIEAIEAGLQKQHIAFAKLIDKLALLELLTADDITDVVAVYSSMVSSLSDGV